MMNIFELIYWTILLSVICWLSIWISTSLHLPIFIVVFLVVGGVVNILSICVWIAKKRRKNGTPGKM